MIWLKFRSFLTFLLISLAVCLLFLILGNVDRTQITGISGGSSLDNSSEISELTQQFNISSEEAHKLAKKIEELKALGLFNLKSGRLGNINYLSIKLDGRIILPIAADIQDNKNILSTRVQKIENTLNEIVKRNFAPNEIRIFPAILNNQTVLVISRTNQLNNLNPDLQQRWLLMTITADDSQLYGIPIPGLSKIAAKVIDDALDRAWEERQPPFVLQQGLISLMILLAMIAGSWVLLSLEKYLVPRQAQRKSMLWNHWLLQVGHAIIWFPGIGLILKKFPDSYEIGNWLLDNTVTISTAIISFLAIGRILDLIVKFGESHEGLKSIPVRVFVQLFYILIAILFILIIIANWVNQPLTNILAAFGAGSAILMLIFKDSIMGFTAGLQLAANRMVSLGDWIEMPKYGADGFVNEVSLFTVKVLNWDNTITLIPTYALISDSFKNWRAMFESGGRKIQRAIHIDMTSIKFCDQSMLDRIAKLDYVADYIDEKYQDLVNETQTPQLIDPTLLLQQNWLTNIGLFRAYVTAYLKAHPKISAGPYFLVRPLQPTEHGLPIEVYVYCSETTWAKYEEIQADIFDHILSVVPEFDLRVFQSPSGYDFKHLKNG